MILALLLATAQTSSQPAAPPALADPRDPPATTTPAPEPSLDWLRGDWAIFLQGKTTPERACGKGEHYEPSPDGRIITLTNSSGKATIYRVIRIEPKRVLTIIEGEDRLTDQGDPVLWWFVEKGDGAFRFKRYDWTSDGMTAAYWQRCQR